MQEGDGGASEMNGGEKRDQPSQTSSSREKRQINSRRIELPMIIGPQHKPLNSEHADRCFILWAMESLQLQSSNWLRFDWTVN
jgi:hypothetical protein